MTTTYGFGFDLARPRSRGARIARIDALATLLDTALVIPGTGKESVRDRLAQIREASDRIQSPLNLMHRLNDPLNPTLIRNNAQS